VPATTFRLALPYPQGTDQPAGPAQIEALANAVDVISVEFITGTAATRPAPSVAGRVYETNDAGQPTQLFWDTGAAWINLGQGQVITAKGDLTVGVAPGAVARLGVGTDGAVLTARSGAADGIDWEPAVAVSLAGPAAITTYTERLVTLNPAGATPVLDASAGNEFALSLSANATVSVANVAGTVGTRISLGVTLTQPTTGGPYTVTWPTSFDWGVNGIPPLSGTGLTDEFGIVSDNNGTTWRAHLIGSGF